jgi:hypothetical protein
MWKTPHVSRAVSSENDASIALGTKPRIGQFSRKSKIIFSVNLTIPGYKLCRIGQIKRQTVNRDITIDPVVPKPSMTFVSPSVSC